MCLGVIFDFLYLFFSLFSPYPYIKCQIVMGHFFFSLFYFLVTNIAIRLVGCSNNFIFCVSLWWTWAIEHILNLWFSFELRLHCIRWRKSSFFHAFLCSNFALHCVSVRFFFLSFFVQFSFCLILDLYFCDFKLWTHFSKFHYSCVTNFSCLFSKVFAPFFSCHNLLRLEWNSFNMYTITCDWFPFAFKTKKYVQNVQHQTLFVRSKLWNCPVQNYK